MAEISVPYISPIRFRYNVPQNTMPRIDKMTNKVQYYKGVYSMPYDGDWLLGEEISIQLRYTLEFTFYLTLVTPTGTVRVFPVDVTPSGWTGDNIYLYKHTPTEEGLHYFLSENTSADTEIISDVFRVHENDLDLVEIKYYDSRNRYDGVFYSNETTLIWQPKLYFTGTMQEGEPKNTYSTYKDQNGKTVRLQSEPQDSIDVVITDTTRRYVRQLNRIFSCDTIIVNGQRVNNEENFEIEVKEKSDGMDVNVNLTLIEDNGFIKNL